MIKPPGNKEFTIALVKALYGIEVIKIKELNAYDDRNFYIQSNGSKEYLVKFTNDYISSEPGLLESMNALILHLNSNGIRVTVPQINNRGTYLTFERIPEEGQRLDANTSDTLFGFRILEYIPGKILLHVPFTPALLQECGEFLAKLTKILGTFSSSVISERKHIYSLLNVLSIRKYLDAVDSPLHKSVVKACLDEFESRVSTRLDELEFAIVHGDFNDQNIIVDTNSDETSDEYHVKGVIDFGDVHFAPKVFDLACYLAHSMLEFKAGPKILAPGFGLSGYMRHKKLNETELSILYYCIKARLCHTLVWGDHRIREDPTNVYVLATAKNGWSALKALHECNSTDILNKWLNIEKHFQN